MVKETIFSNLVAIGSVAVLMIATVAMNHFDQIWLNRSKHKSKGSNKLKDEVDISYGKAK